VTPSEDDNATGNRPSRWVKSNLVALGSAAVLAVYSAGYARTRSAADRFADESTSRRAPEAAAPHAEAPANVTTPPTETAKPLVLQPKQKQAVAPVSTIQKTPPVTADTAAATTPVKPVEPVQQPPVAAPATVIAPPPVDTTTKAADTTHVPLKDGTFMGWGTSRHGDIQAAVEIKEGKIASAFIVQCLTRYSCSWISALPGQVVTRQSAEVDYVSGATQSSNAFYYAIAEALKQAK
jgi:uncharacterized protein with FMN-binding domain